MGVLRIFLAVAVILAHSGAFFGFTFTGGFVAVQIFFIISGFYMTMILEKKYVGRGSYYLFLSNRFLRLYPIYWVVFGLTIIESGIFFAAFDTWGYLGGFVHYFDIMRLKTLLFLIASNILLFGQDAIMFLGMNPASGALFFTSNFLQTHPVLHAFLLVPQAWSLGIELLYYVIAPFIVRRSNVFIIALLSASLIVRCITYFYLGYMHDPWLARFFPSELALFLLGTLSYRFYKSGFLFRRLGRIGQYSIAGCYFVLLVFYQSLFPEGPVQQLYNGLLYLVTSVVLPMVFNLSKSSVIDNRIGEFSYPIYISHILIIATITPFISYFRLNLYKGELAVVCTIGVSYVLLKTVSDPIEKFRQSRVKMKSAA